MASDTPRIAEQGVATLPEETWEQARRRTEVIGLLTALEAVGHQAADEAAQALGLSRRQVYILIQRARQGTGLVTDLAPNRSGGGKGEGRLPESVERIIRELLQKRFLTKQKRTLAAVYREVAQACKAQKLRVPARNTVALRIAGLDPLKTTRRREGQDASRNLHGGGGLPPPVIAPLEQVGVASENGK
jgi:putative transposase